MVGLMLSEGHVSRLSRELQQQNSAVRRSFWMFRRVDEHAPTLLQGVDVGLQAIALVVGVSDQCASSDTVQAVGSVRGVRCHDAGCVVVCVAVWI